MAHVIQQCRNQECRADIIWAQHLGGDKHKLAPINAEPDPNGNIWLYDDGTYQVLTKDQKAYMNMPSFGAGSWHTSHFVTCPAAKKFRRERSATKRDM